MATIVFVGSGPQQLLPSNPARVMAFIQPQGAAYLSFGGTAVPSAPMIVPSGALGYEERDWKGPITAAAVATLPIFITELT